MQAGYEWWKDLDGTYVEAGFKRNAADECVRARRVEERLDITGTYTDDIGNFSDAKEGTKAVISDLGKKYSIGSTSDLEYMLGIVVERNREAGTCRIHQ